MQSVRATRGMKDYLGSNALRVFSTEEQYRLANIAIAGNDEENKKAREDLILSMSKLILKKAATLGIFDENFLKDALQECYVSLWRVFSPVNEKTGDMVRYDPKKGAKPSTYATRWIITTLQDLKSNASGAIRLPGHIEVRVHRVLSLATEFEGISPEKFDELLKKAKLGKDMVQNVLSTQNVKSLDVFFSRGHQEDVLIDLVPDWNNKTNPEAVYQQTSKEEKIKATLDKAISETLSAREARIVRARHELDGRRHKATLKELSKEFGVSRERIRYLEQRSLTRLSTHLRTYYQQHLCPQGNQGLN